MSSKPSKISILFKEPDVPMSRQIYRYASWMDRQLAEDAFTTEEDWNAAYAGHLVKIGFYQHERLVHLIVMSVVLLLTVMTFLVFLATRQTLCLALGACLLLLCVPYILYYFWIENSVQALYLQQEKLLEAGKTHRFPLYPHP